MDRRHVLHRFLVEYEWVHISVGVVGNATFFVGSIFFLPAFDGWLTFGVWLFITGSLLMLFGAVGDGLKKYWTGRYGDPRDAA